MNLDQLPQEVRRNVILASQDTDVQRLIIDAMWDCLSRADTTITDIVEYLTPEGVTNLDTRLALWGPEDENVEEENASTYVYNNETALHVLINEVKEKVRQALR